MSNSEQTCKLQIEHQDDLLVIRGGEEGIYRLMAAVQELLMTKKRAGYIPAEYDGREIEIGIMRGGDDRI